MASSARGTYEITSVLADDAEEDPLIPKQLKRNVNLYSYRWFILALYSVTAFSNTLIWLSLFTVTDATCRFYDVSETIFLWTSNAFTFLQVVIAVPVSFVPARFGLKTTLVAAAAVNALGASVMIAASYPGGFHFFVAGQCIISVAGCILPQLAPEISAVWFGEHEQATSTSIGIIVGNLGAAVGFLQPALLIKNIDVQLQVQLLGEKLRLLIYSQASLCILMLLLILVLYKERPPLPPTLHEALRRKPGDISFSQFFAYVKDLSQNLNFLLVGNALALSSALLVFVPIILNQVIAWKIPHQDATTGWMGFSGVMIGLASSIFFGVVLDKTGSHKALAAGLSLSSLILWLLFVETLAQWSNMVAVFVLFVSSLFVFIPLGPVLVDMASEMTYPTPSSIAYVISMTVGRVYSILLIFMAGWLLEQRMQHLMCLLVALVTLVCLLLVLVARVERSRSAVDGVASPILVPDRDRV